MRPYIVKQESMMGTIEEKTILQASRIGGPSLKFEWKNVLNTIKSASNIADDFFRVSQPREVFCKSYS